MLTDTVPNLSSSTDEKKFSSFFFTSYTVKLALQKPTCSLTMIYLFCSNLLLKECKIHYFALDDLPQDHASVNKNLCCDSQIWISFRISIVITCPAASTDYEKSLHHTTCRNVISNTWQDTRVPFFRGTQNSKDKKQILLPSWYITVMSKVQAEPHNRTRPS